MGTPICYYTFLAQVYTLEAPKIILRLHRSIAEPPVGRHELLFKCGIPDSWFRHN